MSFKQLNDLSAWAMVITMAWAEVAGIVQAILARFSVSKNASLYSEIVSRTIYLMFFNNWNTLDVPLGFNYQREKIYCISN